MNLNTKTVFLLIVGIVIVAIFIWPRDGYKVVEVKDGITVVLDNGTSIRLIGVTNTEQGQQELESIKGEYVSLQPDGSSNFDPHLFSGREVVYAYLLLDDHNYECVNATFLKKGLADLVEDGYLSDSLMAFRKYAGIGDKKQNVSPTLIVQKIDYEADSLQLPQYTPQPERREQKWFLDGNLNIEMLQEACDYNLPYTKMFANQLAGRAGGEFSIEQVCEIFDYCYSHWHYVNDPKGQEYIARASESIAGTVNGNLTGDCDDFAVLVASCILACGGDACIVNARSTDSGHAYPEVDINSFRKSKDVDYIQQAISKRFSAYNPKSLSIREQNGHRWLNLDWQAAYPGGPYYKAVSKDFYTIVDGKWTWEN